jgi:signal transduction histidine kinase
MKVPRRIAAAYFLVSFLLGVSVSLIVYLNHGVTELHTNLELAVGLVFVLVSIVVSGRFLHYQQSLKHAKNNLDEAQELAGIGSWERDLGTGRGYWSDNHYRLFDLQPRKVAPSMDEFFEMIHAADRGRVRETVTAAVISGSSYEASYRLADDVSERIFLSRGKVMPGEPGKPASLVGTVQDITEKRRQELFRDDLLRQKDMFITRLGHDLKTPLTPLVALLPLIRSRAVDDKQCDLLNICIRNANHIKELVVKTIQLARLSSPVRPRLNISDVQLSSAVDDFKAIMADIIEEHGIRFENLIEPDVRVRADLSEIGNLFFNLISNAVKFSPPGSYATISAVVEQEKVTVVVKDNGIGLSTEELPHVFDEFYKADQSRSELGSSGLGLNICRLIVSNHGGRIWAESGGKGYGTAISFTLPTGGAV